MGDADESAGRRGRRGFLAIGAAAAGGALALLAGCTVESTGGGSASASGGSGKLADVLKRKKLIVGTGTGNPPWHFTDQSGKLQGFDIATAKIVAKGLFGNENAIQFVQQSADARIPNLLTNKVDVVFQFMTISALRAQQVAFTIPYYREGIALLLGSSSKYQDYSALKAAGAAARVSVLMNADADATVHEALPGAQVLQLDSQANVIQAMESGRVDASAVDQSTVRWLHTQNPGKYLDAGYGWHPQTYGAAVNPNDQTWLNFLNTVLHEALTGNEFPAYRAAFKQYFGVNLPEPTIGFPMEYAPRG